ncbi:MAG TPA: trypsin-like peptidase domain-containing protein [Armatimonadota bacterium]
MQTNSFDIRNTGRKQLLALVVLIVVSLGVLGSSDSRRPILHAAVTGEQKTALGNLEEAFSAIAQRASTGVVSIATIQSQRSGVSSDSGSNHEDVTELYDDTPHFESSQSDNPVRASGSGTIVRRDGANFYILTNYHVVDKAYQINVKLSDGTDLKGTVIGLDQVTDLAVVQISSPKLSDSNIIPLGDSNTVKVGSWALAVGSPYGFEHTLTVGVISALHRELEDHGTEYPDLIQTDAAINKGNSGGPLLDVEGRVIGINAAIASPTGGSVGLGFAIPVNAAKRVLDDLIKNGRVVRGWLGIGVQDLNPVFQEYYKMQSGVLVSAVDSGGPADKAGIQCEDILVRLGDDRVKDVRQIQQLVADVRPGTIISAEISRRGRTTLVRMTAGISPKTPRGRPAPVLVQSASHIEVRTLSQTLARDIGLLDTQGVIVLDIPDGSPASAAGLDEGDIVVNFNGKKVENQDEFQSMMMNAPSRGIVVLKIFRNGETRIVGFRMN